MFQRTIQNFFEELVGTICFQDYFLVNGTTKSQREKRCRAVQDRPQEKGFTIIEIKSGNSMEKITFLVFRFSRSGMETDDRNGFLDLESELLFGLVNFYNQFYPNFTTKITRTSDGRLKSSGLKNVNVHWKTEV